MSQRAEFEILHISNLHFSEGTDKSNPAHSHSVAHLVGLEDAIIATGKNNFIVVSGDIRNHGDRQSLINASARI